MKIHILQKGETLTDIAVQYGVELESIIKSNPQISAPDAVVSGMKLMIPQQTAPVMHREKKALKQKRKNHFDKEQKNMEGIMRRPIGIALHDDGVKKKSQQNSVHIFRPQDRPFNEVDYKQPINKTAKLHNHKRKTPAYCDCCNRSIYFE